MHYHSPFRHFVAEHSSVLLPPISQWHSKKAFPAARSLRSKARICARAQLLQAVAHQVPSSASGYAGSSTLGDNVSIGGQAGISGHLKIGNNVKIGGGSGVVKDIPDNTVVMGYPAVPLKEFLKKN